MIRREATKRSHPWRQSVLLFTIVSAMLPPYGAGADVLRTPTYPLAGFHHLQGLVVRATYQDSRGFVWLGTDDGLWRWSQGKFRRLDLDPMIEPPVRCMLEHPDETLWVGTEQGLVAIDIVTLEIRTDKPLIPATRINSAYADPRGRVWFGSQRGLYRLKNDGGSMTVVPVSGSEGLPIHGLASGDHDHLWAGTYGTILRVDGERVVEKHRDLIRTGVVKALLCDDQGALWVGVRNPGALYRLHNGDVRRFDEKDGLGDSEVNVLMRHPDGDIWVATEDGVYRYVDGGFREPVTRGNGLRNPDVHTLMLDFEGQVWIGTYGGGVYRLRSPYVLTYDVELGVAHPFVTAVAWAGDGRLIVGTIRGAQSLRPEQSSIYPVKENTHVTDVYVGHDGEVWIADYGGVTRVSDAARYPVTRVNRLAEDDSGRLLVGAWSGLWRLEEAGLAPVVSRAAITGAVRDIHVRPDGDILLGTENGLARVVNDSVEWLLSDQDIRAMREDANGMIWLGTGRGVILWNPQTEVALVRDEGVLNCEIRDIVQDASGNMWLATNTGVIRVNGQEVDRFGPEYGLPSRDVRSLAYDGADALYAGTTQGLVRIDVDRLAPCSARPRVVLSEMTAGSRKYGPGPEDVALPFEQRDVLFEVEGLGWQSAVGVRYTYRLLGLDDNWSTPSSYRSARFSELNPGLYQIQVKSVSEKGLESDIATVSFSVLLPFWRQAWFMALVSAGVVACIALVLREYRRRRQLQLAAKEATRAKGEFVSRMSHEIRTPLTTILACAELLSDPRAKTAQRNEHMRSIVRNGRHLLSLVNNVLDLSKLSEGKMEPDLAPTDLRILLDEVRTVAVHRANGKPVAVTVETDSGVPLSVITDATKLRQILFNLMDNAVRFTPQGAVRLEVSSVARDSEGLSTLRFTVTDTGIGIGIGLQESDSVFQAFRQSDSSISRRYGGTGLGLTIARSLAELLGGALTMKSLPGAGTNLTLELPVAICSVKPRTDQRNTTFNSFALDGVDVLFVDDCEDTRRVLQLVLEQFGASVDCVSSGERAVAYATKRSFDVILLDIHMPETDGIETLGRLREHSVSTPTIAITADVTAATAKRCFAAGFDAFVTKPFESADLVATICKALGRKTTSDRRGRSSPGRLLRASEHTAPRDATGPIESTIASISPALADAAAEFAVSLARDVEALNEARSGCDLTAVGAIAHRLIGAGGTNGYAPVSDVAARLEAAVAADELDVVQSHIRQLELLQQRMIAGVQSDLP